MKFDLIIAMLLIVKIDFSPAGLGGSKSNCNLVLDGNDQIYFFVRRLTGKFSYSCYITCK